MPPPDPTDHPTQLGSYDVLSKIADGGMGTVYKARHRGTGEVVAIKVIAAGPARGPVALQRFEREFLAARVLDHPNVVRGLEYCGTGPNPFLVMEFVDGESLGQRVERAGALPEAEAVALVAQVCDGLQRAHKQGLVHRDVKPDNILVTPGGVAKLTDMGLVKEVDGDTNLTKTGRGLGTPHYMAPEQFRNAKGVDVRGDIYSLGATLYCLVTGVVPFANSNPLDCWMKKINNDCPPPRELTPALSERVDWAIRRAMSADPGQRPASCREFLEDLTGVSRPSGTVKPLGAGAADVWYMVYKDETGQPHTVKGPTESIRSALKDGLLGDAAAILVGRSKGGQFLLIGTVPEFRDLVVVAGSRPSGVVRALSTRRKSGVAATPGSRSVPEEAVDFGLAAAGGNASASRSGRPDARRPAADTPSAGTPQVNTPAPDAAPRTRPAAPAAAPDAAFDWTPVLMVLLGFLSAALGYVLFVR